MLSVYDLYDLHAIFVNIRFFPDNGINKSVIKKVIEVLQGRYDSCDANKFRVALKEIDSIDKDELFAFAMVKNKYCYYPTPFVKDQRIYEVLVKACEQLLSAICDKNKDKIYDLADCLHDLPIMIANNQNSIPNDFWKREVKSYRMKWDNTFLINEQKMFS